jgi:iron complex outermembrane receptor protein
MKKRIFVNFLVAMAMVSLTVQGEDKTPSELTVEELLNVEVTSVSKKAQALNDSAAAVFVITQEDIKRIGARSIPEALRLAPGVNVAKISANKWAVSIRGFNNRLANKLLVLVDGRNLYTRAFSGTYWGQQDVMLEDVERIEVIRGPGATLWGANAVNGVINIITKNTKETQGGLVAAGGGSEELGFGALRYGFQLDPHTTGRFYVKGNIRDENSLANGQDAGDNSEQVQTGFRVDSQFSSQDSYSIQGDAYYNWAKNTQEIPLVNETASLFIKKDQEESFGGNLLFKQKHVFSPTSNYQIQAYYDFYQLKDVQRTENRHAVDLDFQHRFSFWDRNDVVWGIRYRYRRDSFKLFKGLASIQPESRNDQLISGFIQDEITLIDNKLWLTLGSKFEHNDYSGFEYQPSIRALWVPFPRHRLWAAVSRAVRTPSRAEKDVKFNAAIINSIPKTVISVAGNNDFHSERVLSYEIGYRTTIIPNVSIDLTAFYNHYWDLRSAIALPLDFSHFPNYVEQPLTFVNEHKVNSYGIELATVWQMLPGWRWDFQYSFLKMDFSSQEALEEIGRSPEHRFLLRSAMSPHENIDVDLIYRYVDTAIAIGAVNPNRIASYMTLDIRLAWRPENNLEFSVTGQNLLESRHHEYSNPAFIKPMEIDRGVYGKVIWQF